MTPLDGIEDRAHKEACHVQNHKFVYESSHAGQTVYFCKYCRAVCIEQEDCGHGG